MIDIGPLEKQSPDYILEKYNHWIGFEPVTEYPQHTPDSCHLFINSYHKLWINHSDYPFVRRQLLYLAQTQNLNLTKMITKFEEYIGPIHMISSTKKKGLHYSVNEFVDKVVEKNNDNIKVILRDMRLNEIV